MARALLCRGFRRGSAAIQFGGGTRHGPETHARGHARPAARRAAGHRNGARGRAPHGGRNVGSVLVIAHGRRLEGILTERDIVHRVVVPGRDPDRTRLDEVMTKNPDTIGPNEPAIEALRRMRDGGCRHLPVVDEDGRPVGIVSHRDFLGEETTRLEDETRLWEVIR